MVLECPRGDGSESLKLLLISCPRCGSELEMFSDEEKTTCEDCGTEVRNEGI
jgi:DNA-directed RNA polymerase subunit RPC12/RpoP